MAVSIIFIILLSLILCIPILVAVYVYRDANKRGMNAILWMLIALLTPSLLGFIIYLLVRSNYSDLKCPNCDTPIQESFVICPNCRTKLHPTCEVCGSMVQSTWKVCPHCGTDLPNYSGDVATPVRTKDKTLGKILGAILIIPVVLLLLIVIGFCAFQASGQSGYSSSSITSISMTEFLEGKTEVEQELYRDWFDAHKAIANDQPYHIFVYEANNTDGLFEYQYLIYIPGAGEYQDISYNTETKGFFKKQDYWALDITCDKTPQEQHIFIFNYEGTMKPPKSFLINYNGEEHVIEPDSHTNAPFLSDSTKKPAAIGSY